MPRTRPTGWTVTVTHPVSDRAIRVEVLDQPQYIPGPNRRPEIRLPVRRAPSWLREEFDNDPAMTVTQNGQQLPIDTLTDVTSEQGRTVLVGQGGAELRERATVEYREERRTTAATNLIAGQTSYAADVDTPASALSEDEQLQNPSTNSEFTDVTNLSANQPVLIANDEIELSQTSFTFEGENFDSGQVSATQSDGDASNGEYVTLFDAQLPHEVSFDFSTDHDFRVEDLACDFRIQHRFSDDGSNTAPRPGINVTLDGDTIYSVGADVLYNGSASAWEWVSFDSNKSNDVSAGSHTLTFTITEESTDGNGDNASIDIDVANVRDTGKRFGGWTYNLDNSNDGSGGYLDGPENYPDGYEFQGTDATTIFQIIAGSVSLDIDDTTGDQRVQLSNDQGSSWEPSDGTEDNTDSVSVDFSNPAFRLRTRIRLDRIGSRTTATPQTGYDTQTVSSWDLRADLRLESLLIDERFDDSIEAVLNRIAGEEFIWAVTTDSSGNQQISFTQPGQRVALSEPDLSGGTQIQKKVQTWSKVTIKGSNGDVAGEQFAASTSFQDLAESDIITGSEVVRDDSSGTQYARGDDYEMDYSDGEIRATNDSALTLSNTYAIDYRYEISGTYTIDNPPSNPTTLVRTIPGIVNARQAEQIAYVIAEVDPATMNPRYEGTVQLPRADASFDPLEALNLPDLDLPDVATPLAIRGEPEATPEGVQARVGSSSRLEAVLGTISDQVSKVSERV